jgi:signal peptidase II
MLEKLFARWWSWLPVSGLVIALDQVTKHAIQRTIPFGAPRQVTSFFDLVLVFNPGAAFSFLSTAPGWQRDLFIMIAGVASVIIMVLLRKNVGDRLFCFALSLILGGALGNLIDRLMLGAVVDFLHFHIAQYYWPAFNVADSAITCGAGLLIWDSLRRTKAGREHKAVR